MDDTIRYLNTDLDLTSTEDLTTFAAALEAQGVWPLHVDRREDGLCYGTFETDQYEQPEQTIAAMLAAIETLSPPLRDVWTRCVRREFNIGYDCGTKPWGFEQGLSNALLARIAAVGAALRITLYPPESAKRHAGLPASR